MITEWPFIYAYNTNRDDFPFAVGIAPEGGPANGSVALFADSHHAVIFMNALKESIGGTVDDSPRLV